MNPLLAAALEIQDFIASRPLDWRDTEGVLARHRARLDLQIIRDHLAPLVQLKGQPEIMDRLNALLSDR